MTRLPHIGSARAVRLFDGCQSALVWLAVLALAVPETAVASLAVLAMVAIALAAAFVAVCPPALPSTQHPACPEEEPSRVL